MLFKFYLDHSQWPKCKFHALVELHPDQPLTDVPKERHYAFSQRTFLTAVIWQLYAERRAKHDIELGSGQEKT